MVFVEFTAPRGLFKGKHYFVGENLAAVLDDTDGGKRFGDVKFSSYRKITRAKARKLRLDYLDEGIQAVQDGSPSFKLGIPG